MFVTCVSVVPSYHNAIKKDYSLGKNCGKIVVVDSLKSPCDLCIF